MNKAEIVEIIRSLHDEITRKYKVKGIGIFGSYARGEQNPSSDIDVLADFYENADLFDFVGLAQYLEERLGHRVDVVPKRALRKEIRESVLKEVIAA